MKRIILMLAFFALVSSAVLGQTGRASGEKNLRGLKGVRLVVMFARADAVDEAERAGILKLVELDAIAKFEQAHIPLFRYTNEMEDAGFPLFTVYITADKPNGYVYPVVANVRLLQRVRLARDPSIAADLATWETYGIAAPKLTVPVIRKLVADEVDQFINAYNEANPR